MELQKLCDVIAKVEECGVRSIAMLLAQVSLYQEDKANVPIFAACDLPPAELRETVARHPVFAMKTLAENEAFGTLVEKMKEVWKDRATYLERARTRVDDEDLSTIRAAVERNSVVNSEIRVGMIDVKNSLKILEANMQAMRQELLFLRANANARMDAERVRYQERSNMFHNVNEHLSRGSQANQPVNVQPTAQPAAPAREPAAPDPRRSALNPHPTPAAQQALQPQACAGSTLPLLLPPRKQIRSVHALWKCFATGMCGMDGAFDAIRSADKWTIRFNIADVSWTYKTKRVLNYLLLEEKKGDAALKEALNWLQNDYESGDGRRE